MIYKMDNSYYVLKEMDPKIEQVWWERVKEFGIEDISSYRVLPWGDDYIAIEYNNRPTSGFTIDVYNYAHSLDLYKGHAAITAGDLPRVSVWLVLLGNISSRQCNYVYSEEDLLAKYSPAV